MDEDLSRQEEYICQSVHPQWGRCQAPLLKRDGKLKKKLPGCSALGYHYAVGKGGEWHRWEREEGKSGKLARRK